MHWPKSPKEKPCYSLPTVKKLLEQKRKRDTSSASSSSSSSAETGAGASALPVSTPPQATVTDASGSYSNTMGAMAPLPPSGYSRWSVAGSHQPLQQDCPFSPMATSYFPLSGAQDYNSQGQAYSPALTSSFPTQPAQDYSGAMSIHAYPGGAVTSSLPDAVHSPALQPPAYSWALASGLQAQANPGAAGHLNLETLDEARMFLRGMDNSKKTWQDEDGDTILHIYTAKGLREYALAAAENLQALGRLDSKEHKGKVGDHKGEGRGAQGECRGAQGEGRGPQGGKCVFQTVLSFGPVDLEARNFEGQTPLHCAAISHSGTVKALGSAPPAMGDPVLQAQAEDKLSCLQLLISCGASLLSQDIKSNKTVLHLAVKEGNIQLVHYLLRLTLTDMQAFVNMKAHGNTALHMAAGLHSSCCQEEMIRLLLSRGADPSVRNLENDQPAHLLQSGERGEQLKLILKKRPASSRRRITSLQDQE
ncbi:NF-kappa-B inhibitor delta [Anguilla rostrata]|uniref:NF-kappa-B inhibitor delta n=1 Tax=Anguilla rostrata TaxID=7938 RepID=UPI0030D3D7EE